MKFSDRRPEKAILAIITISFVIWSAAFIYKSSFIAIDGKRYFCLFDDAMISMRYAWNFSHGLGLVWNQGERIQGYTNLLMTLLMSFATLVFDKPIAPLFIQMLGAVFMLAIAWINMKIADDIMSSKNYEHYTLVRILSFFCALSYYPLAYWSLMGMETGLLTLLLLLSILSTFKYIREPNPTHLLLISGCLGLPSLTRNDSIVFAIPIWAYVVGETYVAIPKANGRIFGQLLTAISLYFLFIIGQFAFQFMYYGEMLPNTYTLKLIGMPLIMRIKNGIGFIKPFLIETAPILVLSCVELIFKFEKKKLLVFSIVLSAIGYQIYVGGDPWNYWRIMSPSIPLLFILFMIATNTIVFAILKAQMFSDYFIGKSIFHKKYIIQTLVVSLTLIGLLSTNIRFLPEISLLTMPYTAEYKKNSVNIAIALNQLTTNDATIGVFTAGTIPYFTDRKAIDFLGKSDRYIAHLPPDVSGYIGWDGMTSVPGHNKYDLNYSIVTLKPTYVISFKWGSQDLSQWAENKYVKVEYAGITLFLIKDSPSVLWNKINEP